MAWLNLQKQHETRVIDLLESKMAGNSLIKLDIQSIKFAWALLIVAGLLILALGEFTNIDLLVADYYFDAALNTFPWKSNWFANEFMHVYLKKLIVYSGYLLYLFLLIDCVKPWKKVNHFMRVRLRFVAIASFLIPFVIRTIKHNSVFECPWNIDRYGGTAPFLKLLDHIPVGTEIGHCFPAGHATVGIWLAAICVFWLPHNPKVAIKVFTIGLSIGFVMGWVQQMRGAHFLFHTLWTAWLASLVILIMLQASLIFSKDN